MLKYAWKSKNSEKYLIIIIPIYFLSIWLYESNYKIWIGMFQNSYTFIIYLHLFIKFF